MFFGLAEDIFVLGLPPSGSWQDLKDHMRDAGDVCYADVFKDGTGVVEFVKYDDMKYALKKLDDSRFRSHEVKYGLLVTFYCHLEVLQVKGKVIHHSCLSFILASRTNS